MGREVDAEDEAKPTVGKRCGGEFVLRMSRSRTGACLAGVEVASVGAGRRSKQSAAFWVVPIESGHERNFRGCRSWLIDWLNTIAAWHQLSLRWLNRATHGPKPLLVTCIMYTTKKFEDTCILSHKLPFTRIPFCMEEGLTTVKQDEKTVLPIG